MSDLLAARSQMAMSLAFHIIFAVVGIGMPLLMVLAERSWQRTGDPAALDLAKRWAKGTAILFAVGAVSGTVLSFELGLLWPRFMEYAGAIIGMPFSLEGFAFFTEAIFLGIYLYGWKRISPRMHLLAGVLVALSGAVSGIFVVIANAWMNVPVGFDVVGGRPANIEPLRAMLTPAAFPQALHMTLAAYAATGFAVAGVHAFMLLRLDRRRRGRQRRRAARTPGVAKAPGVPGAPPRADAATPIATVGAAYRFHRTALPIALLVGAPAAVLQIFSGDLSAKFVAKYQPAKLAAMEGQFVTERAAPLRIGGWPDERRRETRWAIEVPYALSVLAFGSPSAEVAGLDRVPERDWPPVAIVHVAFQVMVGLGTVMAAIALWAGWVRWRRRDLTASRWLLRALVLAAPMGFAAIEAGWTVTEVGRQPWIIYGVMRTAEAVTPMPGLVVPFVSFTILYCFLGLIVVWLLYRQIIATGTTGRRRRRGTRGEGEASAGRPRPGGPAGGPPQPQPGIVTGSARHPGIARPST
jgi:cytochrome d ubiquinol oxidase subunit I